MSIHYLHPLPAATRITNREEFLLQQCTGKRVLHLGFVDQWLQEEKIASGQWLHARLSEVAKAITGIDLDRDGVDRARQLGYRDVYVGNAEALQELPINFGDYDLIVAGELIEHVSNVGAFLRSVAAVMRSDAEFIITTPNGLSIRNAYFPVTHREVIHPDHVYLFSPTTLANSLERAGLKPTGYFVYSDPWYVGTRGSGFERVGKLAMVAFDHVLQATIVKMFPYFANSLIVTARRTTAGAGKRSAASNWSDAVAPAGQGALHGQ